MVVTLRGAINANHNVWSGILFNGDELLISKRYDITDDVPEEPEDVAVYKGKIYLNTNSDKIYVITSER